MQPTAQAWPIGTARLGAACAAVLVYARAASALITLVIVQMCVSALDYVRGLQRGDPLDEPHQIVNVTLRVTQSNICM